MNLAILHYHLNRGGVTRVIQNHLLALDAALGPGETVRAAVIYGGRHVGWDDALRDRLRSIGLTLHPLPALDYDEEQPPGAAAAPLDPQLLDLLDKIEFRPGETVVHVHNHSVGKNAALPGAVVAAAEAGYALLLQIHDFMEDFRPANFRRTAERLGHGRPTAAWHGGLYPQAPGIHYGVLTSRDRGVLEAAGVAPDRLHLLPNPVPEPERLPPREPCRQRLAALFAVPPESVFLLYPVRCIRRKNVGEALLYSALAPSGTVVGLTLPPLNPAEKPIYEAWKDRAAAWELPCRFETGAPGALGFAENLAASDAIATTSVAEGFGMVFLEAWLADRVLVGRDLPEITRDFTRAGVGLDRLEPRLRVPLDWVGAEAFARMFSDAYRRTLEAYDRPGDTSLHDVLDTKTRDGTVDFADLDEPLQAAVIAQARRRRAQRQRLFECNLELERSLGAGREADRALIAQNRRAIAEHYSPGAIGCRLVDAYRKALASPRPGPLEPLRGAGRILDCFLDPARFRPIRSEPVGRLE